MHPSQSDVTGVSGLVDIGGNADDTSIGSDSDKENAGSVRLPNGPAASKTSSSETVQGGKRRSVRAGFIVDSDSDNE